MPLLPRLCPLSVPKGGGGYVGDIRKALEKGFSEMHGLGGGSGTIFFPKIGHYRCQVGFFLSVLVRFQTDCTAPLPPLLRRMGISGSSHLGGFVAFDV